MTAVGLVAVLVLGLAIGALIVNRRDRSVLGGIGGLPGRNGSGSSVRSMAEAARDLRARSDTETSESRRLAGLLHRLEVGLDSSDRGVVVVDPSGEVVFRNAVARGFAEARHGEALVASTVTELLDSSIERSDAERLVELVGPPTRSYQVTAHRLVSDSDLIGAIAFVTDVSESRRVDSIRRDFVANVSHELKTPIGALSLLAETLGAEDDPVVQARLVRRLQAEAQRVSDTIDDLMTLSAIEERDDSRFEVLDARDVVAGAMTRISGAADLKRIELRPPAPGRPFRVRGEKVQLESAVFNLLDNAVKYSDHGKRVEIRLAEGGGVIAIAIQDEGVGIPVPESERIFERFYRVDKARSRETGGTGLGLAIVRHVVLNHEGQVEVASREGEGSTFTILLPVADHTFPAAEPDDSTVASRP